MRQLRLQQVRTRSHKLYFLVGSRSLVRNLCKEDSLCDTQLTRDLLKSWPDVRNALPPIYASVTLRFERFYLCSRPASVQLCVARGGRRTARNLGACSRDVHTAVVLAVSRSRQTRERVGCARLSWYWIVGLMAGCDEQRLACQGPDHWHWNLALYRALCVGQLDPEGSDPSIWSRGSGSCSLPVLLRSRFASRL